MKTFERRVSGIESARRDKSRESEDLFTDIVNGYRLLIEFKLNVILEDREGGENGGGRRHVLAGFFSSPPAAKSTPLINSFAPMTHESHVFTSRVASKRHSCCSHIGEFRGREWILLLLQPPRGWDDSGDDNCFHARQVPQPRRSTDRAYTENLAVADLALVIANRAIALRAPENSISSKKALIIVKTFYTSR